MLMEGNIYNDTKFNFARSETDNEYNTNSYGPKENQERRDIVYWVDGLEELEAKTLDPVGHHSISSNRCVSSPSSPTPPSHNHHEAWDMPSCNTSAHSPSYCGQKRQRSSIIDRIASKRPKNATPPGGIEPERIQCS